MDFRLLRFLTFFCFTLVLISISVRSESTDSTTAEPTVDTQNDFSGISEEFTVEQEQLLQKNAESYPFQAEVSRLMDIIINALYTQKNVFLRELISNAADALEKARFLSVTDPKYLGDYPQLEIRVAADKKAKTLTIRDYGVGMTKEDLVSNLGTVARSGTSNFLEALAHGADVNLIGQFGVGFYSAFLVADRVTVTSKSNADPVQHIWESTVNSSFTVAEDPRGNTLGRGTRITLHLRDDSTEFLEENTLRETILRFNQFLHFQVYLLTEKSVPVKSKDAEKTPDADEDNEDLETTTPEPSEEVKPSSTLKLEWVPVNHEKPIWLRAKEDITEKEYANFYSSLTKDTIEPLAYSHFSGEGEVEFKSIIFIPGHAPSDSWNSYFLAKQDAIKLYARRVLVADTVYELLPKWLNFIKGVVDSDDLPLKVDRESLSQTKVMQVISKKLVAKFLELLRKLSREDEEEWKQFRDKSKETDTSETPLKAPNTKFAKFWSYFGKNLRVGCVEDDANRDKISKLLRYTTSVTGEGQTITLDEYVARMPEDQKTILYTANDNFAAAMESPYMPLYKKKNYEVLILSDPLDETCINRVLTFESKTIVSIEKSNSKISSSDEEKKRHKKLTKAFKPLTDAWKKQATGKIASVRVSEKLIDDPVMIVTDVFANSAYSERIMKAQTFAAPDNPSMSAWSRHLEINPNHPLIKKLLALSIQESDDPHFQQTTETLLDAALLSSGFVVNNPAPLSRKLFKLLQADAGLDADAAVEEFVLENEDEDELDDKLEEKEDEQDDEMFSDNHANDPEMMANNINLNDFNEEQFSQIVKEQQGKDEL